MSREDALYLDEALLHGMFLVLGWFGPLLRRRLLRMGPVPDRGLVLGRSMVRMRTVRLGGPVVRSVRRNAADVGEVDDVSLYRDSSAAPVLDLRRKLKAILDLLDAIIRYGASFTRAVQVAAFVGWYCAFGSAWVCSC